MIETSLSSAETPNYELLVAYMYVSVINLHIGSPVVSSAQIPNWGRGEGSWLPFTNTGVFYRGCHNSLIWSVSNGTSILANFHLMRGVSTSSLFLD